MAKDRENVKGPTGLQGLGVGPLNVGNLLDTMEFVKNAWSAFGVPSSLAPTADVEELDRRIADLKAVEQWLSMNLNLLRASVQALEVQRGTIATLKAYGAMLGSPASLPGAAALAQAMAGAVAGAMPSAAVTSGTGVSPASTAVSPQPPVQQPMQQPMQPPAQPPIQQPVQPPAQLPRTPVDAMAAAASGEPAAPPPAALPGLDAGAWWNLLHRQFNQIAAAALSAGAAPAEEPAPTGGARAGGGAPVARSRKKRPGSKTKQSSTGGPESGPVRRKPAR
ncbi:MAG: hypothetical protein M9885_00035 [Burkholderiaceae bacterium]|nr:hypothetical protein [Burkholderiaceae bacterium]